MNTSIKQAAKVVWVLSVLKWLAVFYWLLAGAACMQLVWMATTMPAVTLVGIAGIAGAAAMGSWAVIGWMQHMLGQLTQGRSVTNHYMGVARNSAGPGETVEVRI